jgi:integrase
MDATIVIQNPLDNFLYALRAPETKKKYPQRLKFFFDFVFPTTADLKTKALEFVNKAKGNDQFVYTNFINFIIAQNRRVDKKGITAGTVRNYYKAAKLFCEMNDIIVNWKKIAKGLMKEKEYGEDRAPTVEEIIQLMKYPDRRIKPIVLVMASSGIRGGAWNYLKWKHIIPIMPDGEIVAAKIIVYGGEPDEYYSFITGEAYSALKDWIDFRASYGEKITGDSWLMRDLWQTTTKKRGSIGIAAYPKPLKSSGIKSLMERALKTQGIEKILKEGTNHNTRREWKVLHGFRKFFNSVLVNANVNHTKKERLMGHDTRLDNNYFKPNSQDLLDSYLTVVNSLTLNEEFRLRQRVEKLEVEKSQFDVLAAEIEALKRKIK